MAEEAADGAIGARALWVTAPLRAEVDTASGIWQLFALEQSLLLEGLGSLVRLDSPVAVAASWPLEALGAAERRVLALSGGVQDPLRRSAARLGNLGVRIVLGATDVQGQGAARIAQYGRRLKELSHLFSQLAGAVERFQQGVLGSVSALRRELGRMAALLHPAIGGED